MNYDVLGTRRQFMKKNKKRIVAAFMTVLMALTLVPTWLLGGAFATTAKADGKTSLSYKYSSSDAKTVEGKVVFSKELKDGDGTVALLQSIGEKVTADPSKSYLTTKATSADKSINYEKVADGNITKDDLPQGGAIKLTVKKDAEISLKLGVNNTNVYFCIVKQQGDAYSYVEKINVTNKNNDVNNKTFEITAQSGDVYYIFTSNSKITPNSPNPAPKEARFFSMELKGDFKILPAPDATASAITATQDTTDISKVSVDVSGLTVNEKGPDAYYAVERAKTSYGSDAEPDWNDAEEVYKYTGKETSFKYDDTVSKSGTYYYRVVGKGVASDDSVGAATTAGIQYEAALKEMLIR